MKVYIVTAKEMYDIDNYTMKKIGMDGKLLMENAGRAVSEKVERLIEKSDRICIFVGPGNNGGDGFVIARTLMNKRYDVTIVQVVPDEKITGDALYHKNVFVNYGGSILIAQQESEVHDVTVNSDVVIDAILGLGVKGDLREGLITAVEVINEVANRVISVDIPSGLPADEGMEEFTSVQADFTIVIEAPKVSAFLQHTALYYGVWDTVSIGLPLIAFQRYAKRNVWGYEQFKDCMPRRDPYSHKGDHGKGLTIGGSATMPGSIVMTAKAALRAGAGLITIGTSEKVINRIASQCIEATYFPIHEQNNHPSIPFEEFDAITIGMGMGRSGNAAALVAHVVEQTDCPLIIDADGLFHVKTDLAKLKVRKSPTIVTPHPGEMAMLLDISVKELLITPFYWSMKIAQTYNVYVVLKGKHTIITTPEGIQVVNKSGNAGLAKGGSGDVLAGILLALVMQQRSVFQALCNACFIHGKAADLLVEETHSDQDLMASDVIEGISKVYRTLS
ncbi:NAD(P)H-hydrate dehydratase [Virgibacillus byunsanensis]|uniref:Bifunctional NAD(P)H-hydrate repair enzyme n=1 Tax=Virgibacillus byunsanensis TaxID=570945 RepID=A0ABW3LKN3_9BACI